MNTKFAKTQHKSVSDQRFFLRLLKRRKAMIVNKYPETI